MRTQMKGSNWVLDVNIVDWHPGDPFPPMDKAVSNDNETELITVKQPIPPLVVAGFYNPVDHTCYLVYPDGVKAWWNHLKQERILVYMFNAAYDVPTSETTEAFEMLDKDLIMDVGINHQLYSIATVGDLAFDAMSLKGAAHKYLGMELDKGEEKGDEADRLTFHRNVPLTDSQKVYLAGDLVSTFLLGDRLVPQPTVFMQTRADLVLSTMTRNGQIIDPMVWRHVTNMVRTRMLTAKEKLVTFGFPVSSEEDRESYADILANTIAGIGVEFPDTSKERLKAFLAEFQRIIEEKAMAGTDKFLPKGVAEQALMAAASFCKCNAKQKRFCDTFIERVNGLPFMTSKKRDPFPALVDVVIKESSDDIPVTEFYERVDRRLQDLEELLEPAPKVGPVKFLQDYVKSVMMENPDLKLETTKTGKVRVSKDDSWRFEDAGVKSEFLESYVEFKHNEKLLSQHLYSCTHSGV